MDVARIIYWRVRSPRVIFLQAGGWRMKVGSGKRILVVDDEVSITDFIVRALEDHGFEAWAVNNPLRALEQAVKVKPDLILLDFIMPQIVGSELCFLIKAN